MSEPGAGSQAAQAADDQARLAELRTSGMRLDREGRFWHDGETVRHEGLRRALLRWLDRLPDGRHVLRLDERRFAYLDVEDTALVATSLRWQADRAVLGLNDGSEEALDPGTLTVDDAGVLRCQARGGRLEARLGTAAAVVLAERIDETAAGPTLQIANRSVPIGARADRAPLLDHR